MFLLFKQILCVRHFYYLLDLIFHIRAYVQLSFSLAEPQTVIPIAIHPSLRPVVCQFN